MSALEQERHLEAHEPPEASVPGLLALIEGDLPSGRYSARALAEAAA